MNAAEIKLDLFRRIDSLKEPELEALYNKLVALLNASSHYKLSKNEKAAIDEAIAASESEETYTLKEISEEAKGRYPNLRFR